MTRHPIRTLYFSGFVFALSVAGAAYINSSFLETFLGNFVGLIFTGASILGVLALIFIAPRLIKKWGNRKSIALYFTLAAVAILALAIAASPLAIALSFVLYFVANILIFFSLDVFVENYTKNERTGHIRGAYLTIVNIAWVASPYGAGLLVDRFGYSGIYFLASGFIIFSLFLLLAKFDKFVDPPYEKPAVDFTFREAWGNLNIRRVYLLVFLLQFFFAWMVIYMPIYLHGEIGFSWREIGLAFTVMLSPFVLLQYPLGSLSDFIGERKLLILGFIILSGSTLALFKLGPGGILPWAIVLFATRLGAATIEVMADTYFFKNVSVREANIIGFYRTASPFAYILAPLLATALLLFISFKELFVVLGFLLLPGIWLAYKLNDKQDK